MADPTPRFPKTGVRKTAGMDADCASALALQGLTFLAADAARLSRFLALTGIGPDQLRALAGTADFQIAVLDHLLTDESLLLVFAAETGVPAANIATAHQVLAGGGSLP